MLARGHYEELKKDYGKTPHPYTNRYFPALIFGQALDDNTGPKEIQGHPLQGAKLHMDGVVNEAFWLKIEGSGNFLMQEPKEGGQPTETTEVRIAFDNHNIFIAVICRDGNPSGIKAFQKKGMPLWITGRRTYFFGTGPNPEQGLGWYLDGMDPYRGFWLVR